MLHMQPLVESHPNCPLPSILSSPLPPYVPPALLPPNLLTFISPCRLSYSILLPLDLSQGPFLALRCILYELTTLRRAFDGEHLPGLICKILRGK